MKNILAVDIGGTHFRTGLFDEQGRRLLVLEGDTDRVAGREWMLNQLASGCRDLMRQTDAPVKSCGISFGGPVNYPRQSVTSVHSAGWQDFDLGKWMEQTLGIPCRLDNDANAGALGEYHFGAGKGANSMVYITISTGIGSGIVYEGKLIRGKDYLAGEIGHIPMADEGTVCSCGGKGCLESFSSGAAIESRAREWAGRRPERTERMIELSGGPEITARGLMLAAAEGDEAANQILQETTRWLARGVIAVIRILNPDVIVLGGGVSQSGEILLKALQNSLADLSAPKMPYSTEIRIASLGSYSALYGAAAIGMELGNA